MASMNKAILIGNLCADPNVRYTQGGTAVCNFRIAMNDSWVDKSGQKQERTEFLPIVVWGKQGENCAEYLSKGSLVSIEGRIQTREYEKDGEKRWMTEVVADRVGFLSTRNSAGGGDARGNSRRNNRSDSAPGFDEPNRGGPTEEDLPF